MATWNYNNENNHLMLCGNKNYCLDEGDMVEIDNNKYVILYKEDENMFCLVGIECEDIEIDTENLDDISYKLGNIFDNPDLLPTGVRYLDKLLDTYDVLGENEDEILEAIEEYLEAEEDENEDDCDICEIGDNEDSRDNDKIITDKVIDTIADIFKKLLS